MRRGTTLVELLMALAIVAILTGMAVPAVAGFRDRIAVNATAQQVAAAHARARIAAIHGGGHAVLTVTPERMAVARLREGGSDTAMVWAGAGPQGAGVTLTVPPGQVIYGPHGLALGLANRTYRLQRGTAVRSAVVSRLGRVRIAR